MTVESLVVLAITFFLALISSWALVVPFFQTNDKLQGMAEPEQLFQDVVERKERILQALEELEQEFLSEKLSEEDYQQTKTELTDEAVQCLKTLDRLKQTGEGH